MKFEERLEQLQEEQRQEDLKELQRKARLYWVGEQKLPLEVKYGIWEELAKLEDTCEELDERTITLAIQLGELVKSNMCNKDAGLVMSCYNYVFGVNLKVEDLIKRYGKGFIKQVVDNLDIVVPDTIRYGIIVHSFYGGRYYMRKDGTSDDYDEGLDHSLTMPFKTVDEMKSVYSTRVEGDWDTWQMVMMVNGVLSNYNEQREELKCG